MERRFELMIFTAKSVLVGRCEQRFTTEKAPLRATREHRVNVNMNVNWVRLSAHLQRVNTPGGPSEWFNRVDISLCLRFYSIHDSIL